MIGKTGTALEILMREVDDSSVSNDYDRFDVCPSMASSVCALFLPS